MEEDRENLIDKLEHEFNILLDAFEIKAAVIITSYSTISDFYYAYPDKETNEDNWWNNKLECAQNKLGIPISQKDFIVDILLKINSHMSTNVSTNVSPVEMPNLS